MSLQVELFRSDDYVRYGELPLFPLLRAFFEPLIGEPLGDARFRLVFLPVDDPRVTDGTPTIVNLRSSHGYVQVIIVSDGKVLYRHPHPVREIIGPQLQEILAKREPTETHWGFGIRGQDMDKVALIRPAPEVMHGVDVRTGPRKTSVFHMEEVAEPEPPATTLATLGADVDAKGPGTVAGGPVSVVIADKVLAAFLTTTPFSTEVEEGGFLAGRVFRDLDRDGCFIVEVTAAIQAERTGASMLGFTFTGESFLRVSEQISARERDERLLGWYHTHLFAATAGLGLSTVDVDLHRSTFGRPWQVAALINIADDGRVLRFYCADGATMTRARYWEVRR